MSSCPRCGNRDIRLSPSGEYACAKCGHRWPISEIKIDWSYKEFKIEKIYEKFKNVKQIDCEKFLEQIAEEGIDREAAKRIARRIIRRGARGLGERERTGQADALSRCL